MQDYIMLLIGAVLLVIVVIVLFRKVTLRSRCPVCGNRHTDRIARPRWLKATLPMLPIKSFRCLDCYQKYIQIDLSSSRAHRETA